MLKNTKKGVMAKSENGRQTMQARCVGVAPGWPARVRLWGARLRSIQEFLTAVHGLSFFFVVYAPRFLLPETKKGPYGQRPFPSLTLAQHLFLYCVSFPLLLAICWLLNVFSAHAHAHTHARTHAHAHARAHARTREFLSHLPHENTLEIQSYIYYIPPQKPQKPQKSRKFLICQWSQQKTLILHGGGLGPVFPPFFGKKRCKKKIFFFWKKRKKIF